MKVTVIAAAIAWSLGACTSTAPVGAGTVGGAVAGGLVGSAFGSGSGNTAAIIGGALLGGLVGNKAIDEPRYNRHYRTYDERY